jgi:Na+-translocating ferredoxin:NAD+ oxidoreductase RNF subunit RnfB
MLGLGVGLALVLAFAYRKLSVYEDPRIDQVDEMLPHANCGACGYGGCRAFAEAVVQGVIAPGKCTVNTTEMSTRIAALLGVALGAEEKRVARLACAGGTHVARMRARYRGLDTCRGAALVAGGGKGCAWGCLGLADCERACSFGAITMNAFGLPVVDESRCTACGDCVAICPKDLFSLHPVSHRLWVACRNLADGEQAEAECEVACTACGRCAMDSVSGAVMIEQHLAVVHYESPGAFSRTPIERCPTGAIVWMDEKEGPVKGPHAKKITRRTPLPVGME